MPTQSVKPLKLQCPFCTTVSTRGTGLSSHIRSQHSREYTKWNKNPNRLADAAAAATSGKPAPKAASVAAKPTVSADAAPKTSQAAAPAAAEPTQRKADPGDARALVREAYKQLSSRKESIESELARIEALRAEHESVASQVAALEEAMKAFDAQS